MKAKWKKHLDDMFAGKVFGLAKVISLVENRETGWRRVMQTIFTKTGRARVVGVTGFGGVGKSTLTGRIASVLVQEGHCVGIIAIDPSSPFTGGALLGDRIRMQVVTDSKNIFIRSMASREYPGGLCQAARDAVRIMDAFGKTYILVETVGIGQNQVDIAKVADFVMMVCAPGQGDAVQHLKAGIFEAADLFVVNKADLPGADRTAGEIQATLALDNHCSLQPAVLLASAANGEGVDAVVTKIRNFHGFSNAQDLKKKALIRQELTELLQTRLAHDFTTHRLAEGEFEYAVACVFSRYQDPYSVVEKLIKQYLPAFYEK